MSVKVFCKLADCVNWDNGLCGADEIRIDREGYCATYEEIPEETVDELDMPAPTEDLNWEDEEEGDLEIEELGEEDWDGGDEEDEDEEEDADDDDRWSGMTWLKHPSEYMRAVSERATGGGFLPNRPLRFIIVQKFPNSPR